jgi:hypothetical protein
MSEKVSEDKTISYRFIGSTALNRNPAGWCAYEQDKDSKKNRIFAGMPAGSRLSGSLLQQ